jgi:SAM-dependent methyltransferase
MLMRLLDRLGLRRLFFSLFYRVGRPPWDSGVVPPELIETVEGPNALPPGHALDIGCGSGTNSVYLARHGWSVTGVDFAGSAIARAKEKARLARPLRGSTRFIQADVTRLDTVTLQAPCSLLLDIGCLHSLPQSERLAYAASVASHAASGALFLLYAWERGAGPTRRLGATPEEIGSLFAGTFAVLRVEQGTERGMPTAWYWLRRIEYS